jgi:hypothetical protein
MNVPYWEHPKFRPIVDNSLVLWMTSDFGGSAIWEDRSPFRNMGTIYGGARRIPLHPKGVFGSMPSFDGVDDYINCGNKASLNITDAITLEAVVKLEPVVGGLVGRVIMGKRAYSYADPYGLWTDQSIARANFILRNESDVGIGVVIAIDLSGVHYIVGTYNGSVSIIYVDGVERARNTAASGKIKSLPTENVYIDTYYADRMIKGCVIEARIYNRALTPAEIMHNYTHSPIYYMQRGIEPLIV